MKKALTLLLVLIFLTTSVTLHPAIVKAQPKAITVPDDYPTITDALIAASDGGIICVKKGTYKEGALVINKTVTLIGEDPKTTIIQDPWLVPYWDPSSSPFPPPKPTTIQVIANDTTISGFTITGNAIPLSILADRVQVIASIMDSMEVYGNNNTISQNSIKTYVKCDGSFNNFLSNPLIGGGYDGFLVAGDFNVIYNNSLSGCSIEVRAKNNTIAKNSGSFSLSLTRSSSNNVVFGNLINGNLLLRGFNNTFYANEITYAGIGGFHGGTTDAAYNSFYQNNFVGKAPEFSVSTKNPGSLFWNNAEKGNYWLSYNGTDSDNDGIGDSPYQVDAEYHYFDGAIREDTTVSLGQDKYPLMLAFKIDSVKFDMTKITIPQVVSEPLLTVLSPQNSKTYNVTDVSLNVSLSQLAKFVRYSLDGQENVTVVGNLTITDLANGLHNVTFFTDDPFGNTQSSGIIVFNIDIPTLFPVTPVVAFSAVAVVLVAAGLLVYYKRKTSLVKKV